jgi:flagellar hook-associated protein 1 FlgK
VSKIHAMMDIGKRSMMNSQTALQTVSHNIANKNTEGFSRQKVEIQSAVPVTEGRLQFGMGARAAQVSRTHNPFLEKQIQREGSHKGYLDSQAELLSRVEQVFNEQSIKGLNQYISDFFNGFRELANTPESITARAVVKETADLMGKDFARIYKQLSDIQNDINFQLMGRADEANRIVAEIASLNQKIVETEMRGIAANDQRDRRDVLLKQLNSIMDIRVAEGDKGAITVMTAGNGILVSGNECATFSTQRKNSDRLELLVQSSGSPQPIEITSRIQGGSLGGMLKIRDEVIEDLKSSINLLASSLVEEVNKAHVQGFDRTGQPATFFFEPIHKDLPAAMSVKVNQLIQDDLNKIATGIEPNTPGDPTIAHVIAQIQNKNIFDGDAATLDDFYNSQVGKLGVLAQRAIKASEAQAEIVQQLSKLRESISGVSLDEEATKMIEFQKAFDASARLIRTADEMFDTVLNLKRL